jgi:hypothetical protein
VGTPVGSPEGLPLRPPLPLRLPVARSTCTFRLPGRLQVLVLTCSKTQNARENSKYDSKTQNQNFDTNSIFTYPVLVISRSI